MTEEQLPDDVPTGDPDEDDPDEDHEPTEEE